jgi:hypothetical protein
MLAGAGASHKKYHSVLGNNRIIQLVFLDSIYTLYGSIEAVNGKKGIKFYMPERGIKEKIMLSFPGAIGIRVIKGTDTLELININGLWVRKLYSTVIKGKKITFFDYTVKYFDAPIDFYLMSAYVDDKVYDVQRVLSLNFRRGFSKFLSKKLEINFDYKNHVYMKDMWAYFVSLY